MPRQNEKRLPFNKDLNGRQRIRRDQARRAWSWGLPVFQDAGKGAVLLKIPEAAPSPDRFKRFDDACVQAIGDGKPFTRLTRDRCIYLVPYGVMTLHFTFTDGSNPFVKYAAWQELVYELQAWSHTHRITPLGHPVSGCATYNLTEKQAARKYPFVMP